MPWVMKLDSSDPRMIAWEKYKNSEEYTSSRKWAAYEQHVDGALWDAFIEGYKAASKVVRIEDTPVGKIQ